MPEKNGANDDARKKAIEMDLLTSKLFIAQTEIGELKDKLAHTRQKLRSAQRAKNLFKCSLREIYRSKKWKSVNALSYAAQKLKNPSAKANVPVAPARKTRRSALNEAYQTPADRKNVLVIDRCVPMPDKDAGSRSTQGYIDLLLQMGWNVMVLGNDFEAPQPYAAQLAQKGAVVLAGEYYRENFEQWVIRNAGHIDGVLINRPDVARHFMQILRAHTKAKILYFGHDLHFLRESRGRDLGVSNASDRDIYALHALEHVAMHEADTVMMYNDLEIKIIKEQFDIDAITVPLFFYDDIPARQVGFDETKDLLFVGNFAHRPNADGVLWFVKEVLPLVLDKLPDAAVHVVGANPTPEILALKSENIDVTGPVSDARLEEYYKKCRVCVIPLRFGAGVKGKTLEAMSFGLPTVSTAIGVEGMPEIESVIPPADSADAFAASVIDTYTTRERWEEKSKSYKEYLLKYFSRDAARRIMEKALESDNKRI